MDLVKCRIQSLVPLDMRIDMDKSWLFWVSSWSWWFLEFVVTNQFERLPSLDVERGRTTCFDPIYLRRSSWTMIQSNSPQKSLRPWVAFTWCFDSHMRDSLQQALNSHHFWKKLSHQTTRLWRSSLGWCGISHYVPIKLLMNLPGKSDQVMMLMALSKVISCWTQQAWVEYVNFNINKYIYILSPFQFTPWGREGAFCRGPRGAPTSAFLQVGHVHPQKASTCQFVVGHMVEATESSHFVKRHRLPKKNQKNQYNQNCGLIFLGTWKSPQVIL